MDQTSQPPMQLQQAMESSDQPGDPLADTKTKVTSREVDKAWAKRHTLFHETADALVAQGPGPT